MDGSSGIAQVNSKGWLGLSLATFQVAFAVSEKMPPNRDRGLALLDRGDCRAAVSEMLRAMSLGDSSNVLMLHLAQALECDDRTVEALSVTYVDAKTDTAGRIDLLLYRAKLLRELGLPDEAEKVERGVGVEFVAPSIDDREPSGARAWNWSPSAYGSIGWTMQDDAMAMADSLRLTASRIGIGTDVLNNLSQPKATTDDSVHIQGKQIPVSAALGLEIYWSDYYIWIGAPAQAILKTDFSDWLATSARLLVQAGGQWSNRWFESNATISVAKNWTFYPGYDAIRSWDLNAALEWKKSFGKSRVSQSNSGNLSLDAADAFNGFTGAHSLGFVQDLPWESSLSIGIGVSWFLDKSRAEFETLTAFKVKVIDVEGIKVGMANSDPAIEFLDSNGVIIPHNSINNGRIRNGIHPSQRIAIRDGFDYPLESKLDWGRFNCGTVLAKTLPGGVTMKLGIDLARTELVHLQRGTYVPKDALYTLPSDTTDEMKLLPRDMFLYRDVHSGEEYWVGDPVTGGSYFVGPVFFQRHRIDYTTTTTASLSWAVRKHLSTTASWSWIRNRSNLEHLVDGSSYTRSLWNASATVSW